MTKQERNAQFLEKLAEEHFGHQAILSSNTEHICLMRIASKIRKSTGYPDPEPGEWS